MPAKSIAAWSFPLLFALLAGAVRSYGQPAGATPATLSPAQAQAYVNHALANEVYAAEGHNLPMQFQLRRSSPRLTTTKTIIETSDGDVARLISVNGKPLSAAAEDKEIARLNGLLSDPSQQLHRKQSEDADTNRALKILRALPAAFLYKYAGAIETPGGLVEKFTFKPNPNYNPPDLETQVLTAMAGEIWINAAADRVVHLEGRLQHGIAFGWGILGHLNKGGWIAIDQANVGDNQWRTTRLQLEMTGRVLFFSKSYDMLEATSHFKPVPVGLSYREAIKMLLSNP